MWYIPEDELLYAYREGHFPMAHDDGELYWHDPDPRAIFHLHALEPDMRTARMMRSGRFQVTMDRAFVEVIEHCADRPDSWIDTRIKLSYGMLHISGHAHSVETWDDGRLVGGIYGVAIGGAFFGESMFTRVNNAGKVAFHSLVEHLRQKGFTLFDTQYINAFTKQLGAVEVPRTAYRAMLREAVDASVVF